MSARVVSNGNFGDMQSVSANPSYHSDLDCFSCHDESLYHDSFAYWSPAADDLLCEACFAKLSQEKRANYQRVITFH